MQSSPAFSEVRTFVWEYRAAEDGARGKAREKPSLAFRSRARHTSSLKRGLVHVRSLAFRPRLLGQGKVITV